MMRPDERAVESEVQRDQNLRSNIAKGVKTAAAVGTGLASARILPFLSQYIPVDLAMKGLSKVSPKIADFLKRGQSMGLKVEDGIQYLRDNMSDKETKKEEPAKENRNIIEQYSPELHQFVSQQIGAGRKPIEAGAIAQSNKRFGEVIKKITEDHKTPWSSILESIYGNGAKQTSPQQQPQQTAQAQEGPGQQALMSILAKINQKLGQ